MTKTVENLSKKDFEINRGIDNILNSVKKKNYLYLEFVGLMASRDLLEPSLVEHSAPPLSQVQCSYRH